QKPPHRTEVLAADLHGFSQIDFQVEGDGIKVIIGIDKTSGDYYAKVYESDSGALAARIPFVRESWTKTLSFGSHDIPQTLIKGKGYMRRALKLLIESETVDRIVVKATQGGWGNSAQAIAAFKWLDQQPGIRLNKITEPGYHFNWKHDRIEI